MNAKEIRSAFLEFFASKGHAIVPSAPIVIKNDPTLMFTNAGMNQFKDIFLGDKIPVSKRVADTQKCLRVSGKHNDLEEVGIDTYHHTMFEMLGNWSFGDYFKEESIAWAWELLTQVYQLPADRLYVTIFEGDAKEGLEKDEEAATFWKKWIAEDRIISGNKKDNFWEMGDTGPCGPCSEIHFDNRDDEERKKLEGKNLVNTGDPQVIEIWNLVFIQFNRLSNGSLQPLPANHVDTGMGFERLTRVIQQKKSNYDSDIFQPFIAFIENKSAIKYGTAEKTDVAMRVMSDHIRAIGFAIADGQLPSNTGAGYVIRRILRRAVRYYYSFLNVQTPVLFELVEILAKEFGDVFPEISKQQSFVARVIEEEESSFLKTLSDGIKRFDQYAATLKGNARMVEGKFAFELYDTFGFPIDLTQLLAAEKNITVDLPGFNTSLDEQRKRSRKAAEVVTGDWIELKKVDKIDFLGYDSLEAQSNVVKYRKQKAKDKEVFQLVLNQTPFYAESGGQLGDQGKLFFGEEEIKVLDTKKENELIIHFVNRFPKSFDESVLAKVDVVARNSIMSNHTATHLMHAALRKILGTHVQQKGSLVAPDHLRFDFSHFAKVTREELDAIETMVNQKIRENIIREVDVMPVAEAMKTGAMALFGEKYGDKVRVVTFDKNFSRELCGGTHVHSTGAIGYFKIISEAAVAAGVRRIEAITGEAAEQLIRSTFNRLETIGSLLGNAKDAEKGIQHLQEENAQLKKQVESFTAMQVQQVKEMLKKTSENIGGIQFIGAATSLNSADALKKLAYDLRNEVENLVGVFGAEADGKAHLMIIISDNLVKEKSLDAGKMIRIISKEINGGGGGQKFFASAGGTHPAGINKAIEAARDGLNATIG
ncbi:MAG: alanine--tRNA ligase [Chitinophagaceae bacterium]|nr:alanine--tRNA ligase [Chitinophagaceae bacterium]